MSRDVDDRALRSPYEGSRKRGHNHPGRGSRRPGPGCRSCLARALPAQARRWPACGCPGPTGTPPESRPNNSASILPGQPAWRRSRPDPSQVRAWPHRSRHRLPEYLMTRRRERRWAATLAEPALSRTNSSRGNTCRGCTSSRQTSSTASRPYPRLGVGTTSSPRGFHPQAITHAWRVCVGGR